MSVRRVGVLVATTALLTLAACGDAGGEGGDAASLGGGGGTASPEGGGEAGGFPATVQTAFGQVTVESEPQTVVALGWGDAETALALGVQPVAASDWLGFGGEGVGPWAQGLYDSPPEIIETLEPSYEAIGALEPDLILEVKSSGDPDRYERLSQIATTVSVPEGGENYLTTREEQVDLISTALGVPDAGQALLDDLDAQFAQVADANPQWEGQTVTAASLTSNGWGAYISGSERVAFLERLGFEQNHQIAELPTNAGGFSVDISSERLDLLDADLIVAFPIYVEPEQITQNPLWQQIPAVQDGRVLIVDSDAGSAYSLGSTMAAEYALEQLVPDLQEATGQ